MESKMTIPKRIIGTLALPVLVYVIMLILTLAQGKTHFISSSIWLTLIVQIAAAATTALGIGLQFKGGRFDFSGGGIMLLSAIIAGNVARLNGNNLLLFMGLCLIICLGASILVGLVYVYGRLPIVIATIGMALLFESITTLIFNGGGVNLVANMDLKRLSTYPYVLFPFLGAILLYAVYSSFTVSGKQAELLANNQEAAVNIGINEKKNVLVSYMFSGLIFGFATMIYASMGLRPAAFQSLVTVGSLFSNILPVFIGLMLRRFCGDTIGTITGAITLSIMSYGLSVVFAAEMGAAISIIITGIFVLVINVVSAQGSTWLGKLNHYFKTRKVA